MSRLDSPHDKLVKEAFGSPEAMRAVLRSVLTHAILARLDLGSLTAVAGSFVDDALVSSYSDLLFRVSLQGRTALVYVLVEHKSRNDRWTVFQVLRYCVRIWERALRDDPRMDRLPPIIPLVVAHDPSGWSAPRSFLDVLDPIVTDLPDLARHAPQFEVLVDDLSRTTDEQLQARAMGLFGTVAAAFLRDARTPERVLPMLRRLAGLLGELWQAPDGKHAVTVLLRYLSAVADADVDRVIETIEETLPEAKELIMTIAEQLEQRGIEKGMQRGIEKGMQKGIEKGIEKGLQEGRLDALRATVRKLLMLRFGELDRSVLARIDAADLQALDRYTERVLTAASVDDVFAP